MNEINIRVGSGSVAWNPSKNVLNRGSTKVERTMTVPIAITRMTSGYTSALLILFRASRSRLM